MRVLDRLRRRRLPALVEVDSDVGALLLPAADRMLVTTIERDGVWEPAEGAALRGLVTEGMTVLDVGAHCGYFTLMLSRLVGPRGSVVALEPAPENFALLKENLRRAGAANVRALRRAAWSHSGEALPLSLCAENTGDHRTYRFAAERPVIEVDSLALDDLEPPLDRLDLVKLDTQGTEHRVVEGMRQTIERLAPVMLAEFWPDGIRQLGDSPAEVIALYREIGMEIEPLDAPDGDREDLVALAQRSPTAYLNLLLRPAVGEPGRSG